MSAEQDESRLWFGVAAGALLVVAAALRAHHGSEFSGDEAAVADLIRRGGAHPPLLFYAVERVWSLMRGDAADVLRCPPAFFGVLAAALPFAALRLERAARFAWSMLLAFSTPLLLDSVRLAPATLEAAVSVLLIVLFLRAQESERGSHWLLFFVVAAGTVTTLLAPIVIVITAALLALLLPIAHRGRVVVGFGVVGGLFALSWIGWMSAATTTRRPWIDTLPSLVDSTRRWLGDAFNLVPFWWLMVTLLVLLALVSPGPGTRKLTLVTFAVVPPSLIALAGARHLYPYGDVRWMIVCVPGLYLLVASSIAAVARPAALALLLLFGVPYVFQGVAKDIDNRTYMHVDDLTPPFTTIAENHAAATSSPRATEDSPRPFAVHRPPCRRGECEWNEQHVRVARDRFRGGRELAPQPFAIRN